MLQETRFQELKRYVRFDADDAQLLLACRPLAAPELPRIAREFYERICEHSDAHEVFADGQQVQRLQRSLMLWMARIFGGVYDEQYYEQTSQIGRVHASIGLPQRYMLTAMTLVRIAFMRIADGNFGAHAAPTREAVNRILDLDLAVMLGTYQDSFVERIRQVERQRSLALGDALARAEQRFTVARALEERARHADKLAAVGILAAGLAHQIRNPLNGAHLHVAILERAIRKNAGEQDMLDAARVVGAELKRLAELVTEFLAFARPMPLQLSSVSLLKICEDVSEQARAQAESAGVTITCQLATADLEFRADYDKVRQVLLNLVQNALEAASSGGSVVLRGRPGPQHVLIDVEDDGVGLPTPPAPIFEAFFSTKQGRAGLGLAVAHRIVTDHRGAIDVSSKGGKTTFLVTLPLEQMTENSP